VRAAKHGKHQRHAPAFDHSFRRLNPKGKRASVYEVDAVRQRLRFGRKDPDGNSIRVQSPSVVYLRLQGEVPHNRVTWIQVIDFHNTEGFP
jgi:hypothetical protein